MLNYNGIKEYFRVYSRILESIKEYMKILKRILKNIKK